MAVTQTPIDEICEEIARAIDAKLYYLALAVTLSLPNICASLLCDPSKTIRTTNSEFKQWVRDNLKSLGLTEDEFYGLRCGVLHSGRMEATSIPYRSIAFTLPHPNNIVIGRSETHNNGVIDITFDLRQFSETVIAAAKAWLELHKHEPNVAANLPFVVRYRREGSFSVRGLPVIA
jgi:hypothetical protein